MTYRRNEHVYGAGCIYGPKSIMLYGRSQHILRSVALLTNISKHVYTYLYRTHLDESGRFLKKLLAQIFTDSVKKERHVVRT